MMDSNEILEKLSIEEKIEIVADISKLSFEEDDGNIVRANVVEMDDVCGFSALKLLGNCWNNALAEKFFAGLSKIAINKGGDILMSSSFAAKNSPYSQGLSEDPCVNRNLINGFVSATDTQGIKSCVEIGMSKGHLSALDIEYSKRAFKEYYFAPIRKTRANLFSLPMTRFSGEYAQLNENQIADYLRHKVSRKDGWVIAHDCDESNTVKALATGNILLGCDPVPIKRALTYYQELQSKIDNGEISPAQLDNAVRNYIAFSPMQLDEAFENVLNFAESLGDKMVGKGVEDFEGVLHQIADESIVLMKNDQDILPIKKSTKMLVIGSDDENDVEFVKCVVAHLGAVNHIEPTCALGYSFKQELSDDVVEDTVARAKLNDVTLLILNATEVGINPALHKLSVSQLSLLDKLNNAGCRVIAFMVDPNSVDASFDRSVQALLSVPCTMKYTPASLVNILIGKVSPSGKLINTNYIDTKHYFDDMHQYVVRGETKIGPFVGYRYYESSNIAQRYPFGYGLSYSKFKYQDLKIVGQNVSFTLRNIGNVDAYETVQLYVGKKDTKVPRPSKELKYFVKVFVPHGTSKPVKIELDSTAFAVFHDDHMSVEGGEYEVKIGSSVADIRLEGVMNIHAKMFDEKKEHLSVYLQSKSNILKGGYTMTPVKRRIKALRNARNSMIGVLIGMLLIEAMLLCLGFMDVFDINGVFSVIFDMILVPIIIGLLAIAIGIVAGVEKKKLKDNPMISTGDAQNKFPQEMAQSFRDLFDGLNASTLPKEEPKQESLIKSVHNEEFVGRYDAKITPNSACADICNCMANSGVMLEKSGALNILSSFMASRILLCNINDNGLKEKFFNGLSAYFDCEIKRFNISGKSLYDFLFNEVGSKTEVCKAIESCGSDRDKIHLVVLEDADVDSMARIFAPVGKFSASRVKNDVPLYRKGEVVNIELYPNIWFILCPKNNVLVGENISLYNASCTLNLQLTDIEGVVAQKPFKKMNFYQFFKMEENILSFDRQNGDRYNLDEDKYWKRIDAFENYLNSQCGYSFGNQFNLGLERFAITYLSAGGETDRAYDSMVASRILPLAMCIKQSNPAMEDTFNKEVDNIFAEKLKRNKESSYFMDSCDQKTSK